MWKQRDNAKIFCRYCGNAFLRCKCKKRGIAKAFRKILGEAEITEVFKIEMGKGSLTTRMVYWIKRDGTEIYESEEDDIAKRDGFKSTDDMFKWFDERYSLSRPKPFWVYMWRWI